MNKEPCMTLSELAAMKGYVNSSAFSKWAKVTPLPKCFLTDGRRNNKKYYPRSELLSWYERAKPNANKQQS